MAVGVVHPLVVRAQGLVQDVHRVGNNVATVHRDAALGADENRPAVITDFLTGITGGVDHHAIGIAIVDGAFIVSDLDRSGGVRVNCPLDNIVMVGSPV